MVSALRQSATPIESREYLAIDRAAALTGESVRNWRRRAQWEDRLARQQHRESLAIKRAGSWHVARSIDPRLTVFPSKATRDERDRPGLLATYPTRTIDLAYRRNHWLQRWRRLCDRRRDGETELTIAAEVIAECRRIERDFRISTASLKRWHRAYSAIGADGRIIGVEALIDRRSATSAQAPELGRDPAAVEYFQSLFRTENKLTARMSHDATVRAARKNCWAWPGSYTATTRWLREHDDRSLTFLLRYGKDRWARRFLSHVEVNYDAIGPGDLYVCDHHQADWWCTYKGRQIRPWITAVQDCSSRIIVGWHLGPSPHQDAILASMRRAFREYAVPVKMRIDNGRDYTSKLITGVTKSQRDRLRRELGRGWQRVVSRNAPDDSPIDSRWLGVCGELGIELIYAHVHAPWAKGTLERFFGTLSDHHGKTYATYCGNSTVNKPECLDDIRRGYSAEQRRRLHKLHGEDWKRVAMLKFVDQADVPTLDESRKALGEWIEAYHLSAHRGLQGATPLAMWQTATSLRRAVDDDLMCLMETRGVYRVAGNGLRVKVGSATIGYGQGNAALKRYAGRDVLVLLNPDDISHVWAFTPDTRKPIARLDANRRIAPNTCADDAREAIAERMRERKVMHAAKRSSARRTKTQVDRINEHSRAMLHELRATGTTAVDHSPVIVPVQTGFEGVSRPGRGPFDIEDYCPADPGELEDLFEADRVQDAEPDGDEGMEDLFVDETITDDPGDDLEGLL